MRYGSSCGQSSLHCGSDKKGEERYMATTKIKPIRKTLASALVYITDPEKTADRSLVSSFGCGLGTADIQMQMTAQLGSGRGNRIAYHLMQSFSPDDDVTPERAHMIGKEFAQKVLKGKYEFVISTHIDKDHIHNHIIFNATNFYDHTKYHYGIGERDRIRGISDALCRENGLSVVVRQSGARGKGWHQYQKERTEKEQPYQERIRKDIDAVIVQSASFDEFLQTMEKDRGYTIARRGSILRLRPPGYAKFFRLKDTLGAAYTEGAIRDRIEHPEDAERYQETISKKMIQDDGMEDRGTGTSCNKLSRKRDPGRIDLIIDISKNIKAQESRGYEQALIRSNIDTLVRTMNFLIGHGLKTEGDLRAYHADAETRYESAHKDLRKCEEKLFSLSEKIKFLKDYKKYHNLYAAARRAGIQSDLYKEHEDQIILFEASRLYFDRISQDPDELDLTRLFAEYKDLGQERSCMRDMSNRSKKELKEMDRICHNIKEMLGIDVTGKEEQTARGIKERKGELSH